MQSQPPVGEGSAALMLGRRPDWNYNEAINIDESKKVFYLYRGVLIVLVIALPQCSNFLGLTFDNLMAVEGEISQEQFDKAIWLMCNAMEHLKSDTQTLTAAYDRVKPYIDSFDDEGAKQGGHAIIAKSISRIVIRFLFALSLNLRGIDAPVADAPVAAAEGEVAMGGDDDSTNIPKLEEEIENAKEAITNINDIIYADDYLKSLQSELAQNPPEKKEEFLREKFAPIFKHLDSLGATFEKQKTDIETDIVELKKINSSRLFEGKLRTLKGFIENELRYYKNELIDNLENAKIRAENKKQLEELLRGAGNTFDGVNPIKSLTIEGDKIKFNSKFIPNLLQKALVLQSNISKLLVTPIRIADKPSIKDFLSTLGLLDTGGAGVGEAGGDDDDSGETTEASPLLKRLRSILEPVGAQGQCDQTVGKLNKIPGVRCYICGGGKTGFTMECEHIFCIGLAIEYFGLLRCSGLSQEEKNFLSILYAWAHRCCNRLKSNISFMTINPTYKAPIQASASAPRGRDNFFMFHEPNATKLLIEIFNNNKNHDCGDPLLNKGSDKGRFVSSRLIGVSQNVMPLVNVANTVFHSVFKASSVLLTAMSIFKQIASLLIIQAAHGKGQETLTLNGSNMMDGFKSIINQDVIVQQKGGAPKPPSVPEQKRGEQLRSAGIAKPTTTPKGPPIPDPLKEEDVAELTSGLFENTTLEIDSKIKYEIEYYTSDDRLRENDCPSLLPKSEINPDPKYSFMFQLTEVTHRLNPMCLYTQLLSDNSDQEKQDSNIGIFGQICNHCVQTRQGDLLTLNELSVILLCQVTTDHLSEGFPDLKKFDVLAYMDSNKVVNEEFRSFDEKVQRVQSIIKIAPDMQDVFRSLCLLQYASFMTAETPDDFLKELFLLYCPFVKSPPSDGEMSDSDINYLPKQENFQSYCQANYNDFFMSLTNYDDLLREYRLTGIKPPQPESQGFDTQQSQADTQPQDAPSGLLQTPSPSPPKQSQVFRTPSPPLTTSAVGKTTPGTLPRKTLSRRLGEGEGQGQGGSSLKKRHQSTKKRKTRRNKRKYTRKHKVIIKKRKTHRRTRK